jgi:hypothetical protein
MATLPFLLILNVNSRGFYFLATLNIQKKGYSVQKCCGTREANMLSFAAKFAVFGEKPSTKETNQNEWCQTRNHRAQLQRLQHLR